MSKSKHPIARTIAATLERRIVDGSYLEGAPVKQADIALEFGVSHIPVREALAALAQNGLIEISPNRGATVTRLSADQCMELAEMRVALEALAMKSSIQHLTEADIALAETAMARDQRSKSLEDRAKWNWAFHRVLYSKADRPFLLGQLEILWRHADRYLQFAWKHADYGAKSDAEHLQILEAIKLRESATALAFNRKHILEAARATTRLLRLQRSQIDFIG